MIDNKTKDYAIKAARILDDKKGEDIKIYDLTGRSTLCDFVVLATASSTPHLEALEQEASTQLKQDGVYKNNRDGGETGTWRISDYGGFMLHILSKTSREYYDLDKLFSFGKAVVWEVPVKKVAAKKTAVKKVAAKKPVAKKAVKAAVKKVAVKATVKKVAVKAAVKKAVKTVVKKTAVKAPAKKVTVKKVTKKATLKKTVKKVSK